MDQIEIINEAEDHEKDADEEIRSVHLGAHPGRNRPCLVIPWTVEIHLFKRIWPVKFVFDQKKIPSLRTISQAVENEWRNREERILKTASPLPRRGLDTRQAV